MLLLSTCPILGVGFLSKRGWPLCFLAFSLFLCYGLLLFLLLISHQPDKSNLREKGLRIQWCTIMVGKPRSRILKHLVTSYPNPEQRVVDHMLMSSSLSTFQVVQDPSQGMVTPTMGGFTHYNYCNPDKPHKYIYRPISQSFQIFVKLETVSITVFNCDGKEPDFSLFDLKKYKK